VAASKLDATTTAHMLASHKRRPELSDFSFTLAISVFGETIDELFVSVTSAALSICPGAGGVAAEASAAQANNVEETSALIKCPLDREGRSLV
jgi:hypothetical protein